MGSPVPGKSKGGEKMKIALAIITMALGLIFAFSESPTMIPNFLGAIAFMMSGIVVGNCIYRGLA